jgi:hypothetical protein
MQGSATEKRTSRRTAGDVLARAPAWAVVATLAASILALAGLAIGILDRVSGSSAAPPIAAPTTAAVSGDRDALMLAGRAGDVLVGLAVRPGGPVDVTAVSPDLVPLPAEAIQVTAGSRPLAVTSCGHDCFRAPVDALRGRPIALAVRVERAEKASGATGFLLPARPPRAAASVLRRVNERMGALRTVQIDETLSSGLATIRAHFDLRAPDRLSYAIAHGSRAVVIGARRWDFEHGRWRESETASLRVPSYIWQGASRARLVGHTRLNGEPVRILVAFRPSSDFPAWFRLYVAPDDRVLEAHMLAPAHFMVDRFSGFDRPLAIEPPR